MRTLGWIYLLLLLAACFATLAEPSSRPTPPPPTLTIRNFGIDAFSIHLADFRVGTAMPGTTSCFALRNLPPGRHGLLLRALGTGVIIHAPIEDLTSSAGWSIELGQSPSIEVHSLQPAAACKP